MGLKTNFLPKLIFAIFCDFSMFSFSKTIWNHINYQIFDFI